MYRRQDFFRKRSILVHTIFKTGVNKLAKIQDKKQFLKNVWALTKGYWHSEERNKAFFLLGVIIVLTLAIVYVVVLLNQWFNTFYEALQQYNTEIIFDELIHFSWLAALYIIMMVYSFYLQQMLTINWRRWLTARYLEEWLKNKNYYRLQVFGNDTDNPDQRISEDVRLFVEMTLGFTIGILKAVCTFVSFVVVLYKISGPLDFEVFGQQYHIEGYMVWVALIYSVLGTWLTHVVGKKLVALNFVQQKYEANFRFSMMRMRENAESIAFYSGERRENSIFTKRFNLLIDNFWRIIQKRKQLIWINSGYSQIAIIFPMVVAMPRYLAKEITLGGLMQISNAFGKVQDSLSYFVDMYASIAEWQSVVNRLTGFGLHMKEVEQEVLQPELQRTTKQDVIVCEDLYVNLPNGETLLQDVNISLEQGKNVLIAGVSGSGKSTLLRVIAGIWPYTGGKLALPDSAKSMFIPQKPYLPLGTLKEALLYPGAKECSDDELLKLLEECSIGYLADKLYIEADWAHVLSGGEQQRLAFVRALVYMPEWLFLDEATSALDEETEHRMYNMLKIKMPQTTVISIGHRSTLKEFHALKLFIDKQNKKASLVEL